MKLLHILGNLKLPPNPDEGVSGSVRAALELARAQARQGHQVTLVAVGPRNWESSWQGVTLRQLPVSPWAQVRLAGRTLDLSTHYPLVRFSHMKAFDVVQGHLYYYLRFLRAGIRVAHFHADPLHGLHTDQALAAKRADFRLIAQHSDAQIAVSHYIAEQVGQGIALSGTKGRVETVYNGVLHDTFGGTPATRRGETLRASLGIPRDAVVFLFVGAIVPEKGLKHLVLAFSRLAKRNPQAVLLVVGSASLWDMHGSGAGRAYENELMALLQPLIHTHRAYLLSHVKSSDMPGVYAASDVTVMPSVWPEPFGLVALEALAAGKPVIASHVGGLPELVGPHNGRLVPPEDERALETCLEAFTDPELRAQTGRNARESATRFSWSSAAKTLEQVYAAALSRRAA